MAAQTYATGKPLPPRDQWVPRVFFRNNQQGGRMFYVIDLPADDDLNEHAELNPGTLEIRDALTDEVLWRQQ